MNDLTYQTYLNDPATREALEREARRLRREAVDQLVMTPVVDVFRRIQGVEIMKEKRIQLRHVGVLTALAAAILLALGTSGSSPGDPRESAVNEEMVKKAHASAWTLTRVPAGSYIGDEYARQQRELNSRPDEPVAATF